MKQAREKFKRCVAAYRDASMKVKTDSGIKRFQESKGYGTWFGKLLPIVGSMENCQPEQSIELGMDQEAPKETESNETPETTPAQSSSETPPSEARPEQPKANSKSKKKSYVPSISGSKKTKTESLLNEIKSSVAALKTVASDNSTADFLTFLIEESDRQKERDDQFMALMRSLIQPVQQPPAPTTYPNFPPASYPVYHHQATPSSVPTTPLPHPQSNQNFAYFPRENQNSAPPPQINTNRYGMTNARVSSTLTRPTAAQSLNFDREMSYSEQLTSADYP